MSRSHPTDPLLARDAAVMWHPYTQHALGEPPLPVASAHGAWLNLTDGRRLLDAVSSWWVNLHGHGHPALVSALSAQAARLEHVLFAGCTHEPAVHLGERLIALANAGGANVERVFYSDNGSTAVEVALKIAFQAAQQRGETGRTRFLALHGAYHGDTFGAMAVGEPEGFHSVFRPLLAPVDFIRPDDLATLNWTLETRGHEYAAMIVEPLVQGAAGMRMYSAGFLAEAARLCRGRGVALIADEVFTGFGRTGTMFAFEQAGVSPDLICLSKGLTAGMLPLAATLATRALFECFQGEGVDRAFLHGHSFMANPLACAVANASLDLLLEPAAIARRAELAEQTRRHVAALRSHRGLKNPRSLGLIGAADLRNGTGAYGSSASRRLRAEAATRGVLLRPLGDVLYAVPPYCVTDEELATIWRVLGEIAAP
jgi:adenosylmethionine-8-amino-7-oxononanoate aminotransferase